MEHHAQYNITEKRSANLSVKLPCKILRDLALRAKENGHSIDLEISIRLSRSLERDLQMIDADNELAYIAFQRIEQAQKKEKKGDANV